MYSHAEKHHVPYGQLFRWCARAGGVLLFLTWLGLVVAEAMRSGYRLPAANTWCQAAVLAIVFAGYALGWRKELAGGVLAILGTTAFIALGIVTVGVPPGLEVAWFAAPGVLYLLAWLWDERRHEVVARP